MTPSLPPKSIATPTPPGLLGPLRLLALAAWFGLLTGLIEASVRTLREGLVAGIRVFTLQTLDRFWFSTLADLGFLTAAGLVLAVAACARRVPARAAVFVYTFVGVFALRFATMVVHQYAWWLLATGVAASASRLAGSRAYPSDRAVRRGLVGMTAVILVPLTFFLGGGRVVEMIAKANLPPPPRGAPNVLLIVLDTVRARDLSLYGYPRRTSPFLERLAEKGVRFDHAISTCSWTSPSHAGMFTGRYPIALSSDWLSPLDATHPTLAEALGSRGYATAGFVANYSACGLQTGLGRGFQTYDDRRATFYRQFESNSYLLLSLAVKLERLGLFHAPPSDHRDAAEMNRDVFRGFPLGEGRPFFVFINYWDAHDPYDMRKPPFDRMFPADAIGPRSASPRSTTGDPKNLENRAAYDDCIASLDDQIGRLMGELGRRGLLANTLVIVTADHGEQFGENGLIYHGNSLYIPLLHVPLLISFPGRIPEGRSVREGVTLADLPATVMDLLGFGDRSPFPGASLARRWRDEVETEEGAPASPLLSEVGRGVRTPTHEPVSRGPMKSLVAGDYHYILNGDGREEIYDWRHDPSEEQDLYGSERGRGVIGGLRSALKSAATR